MMRTLVMTVLAAGSLCSLAAVTSPDGRLALSPAGSGLSLSYEGRPVITIDLQTDAPLQLTFSRRVTADYQMLSGKRRHCTNEANEYVAAEGAGRIVFRLYNDGLAFRYDGWPQWLQGDDPATYIIPEGMRRWMQQWTDSYEGFFPLDTTYKVKPVPSYSGISASADGWNNRWAYPALTEPADGLFALITEADISRGQSASCLYNDGERYHVVPAPLHPSPSTLHPSPSPWRVVIAGTLADVVQSTLVTDVSQPCRLTDTSWIHPGLVSWVYWAYNHGSNDYDIICRYVDLAATLRLPYVLIDAEWDTMKDGRTVEDAIAYARSKGVKPMIWYNSSVGWVDGAPTPKFRLNKAEDREREFAWCEEQGVAGVKIDFFSGDDQRNMDYCLDLLECAARHHLLVNFHGATIPRGWQRTWPNLLTTEAVYGAEWYNNVPTFTAKAAAHNATLPFTRNVIGPMDYTPCAFSNSQHPHITTHAHELALTVLFESGLQHLADRPESLLAQPAEVRQLFGTLPAAWDDTRLLAGYPGEQVVMARRSGSTWYVAGINGTDAVRSLPLPLSQLGEGLSLQTAFLDDGNGGWNILPAGSPLPSAVTCQPRGGFIYVFNTITIK